jgi:hypothetical protein
MVKAWICLLTTLLCGAHIAKAQRLAKRFQSPVSVRPQLTPGLCRNTQPVVTFITNRRSVSFQAVRMWRDLTASLKRYPDTNHFSNCSTTHHPGHPLTRRRPSISLSLLVEPRAAAASLQSLAVPCDGQSRVELPRLRSADSGAKGAPILMRVSGTIH